MALEKLSPCKVNLLLNILGKRPDGFHELESLMHPVNLHDRLAFETAPSGIDLTCSDPELPRDSGNLVHRAAAWFLQSASIPQGVRIHLEKRVPAAAGLGGGSANAAITLTGLNELFGCPLSVERLTAIAAKLGSDVPFFLQNKPALATGRGEVIRPLDPFPGLSGMCFLLVRPGFGVSTPWAYGELSRFPEALHGRPGRAERLSELLRSKHESWPSDAFYNSLEAPVLQKYPVLALFQSFFREHGAKAALMSGSGSTTFALADSLPAAEKMAEDFRSKFGNQNWVTCVPVDPPGKGCAPD